MVRRCLLPERPAQSDPRLSAVARAEVTCASIASTATTWSTRWGVTAVGQRGNELDGMSHPVGASFFKGLIYSIDLKWFLVGDGPR